MRRLSRRWPLTCASSSGWSPRVRSACTAWSLSRVTAFSTTSWPHSTRSVSCNLAATWGKQRLSSSREDYKEPVPLSGSRPAPHPAGKQTADTRVRNPSKYVAIRAGRAQQSLIQLQRQLRWPLEKGYGQRLILSLYTSCWLSAYTSVGHWALQLTTKTITLSIAQELLSIYLPCVYKLFHSGLKPPDLELHGHQLVGTHDGLMTVSPAFP